MVRVSTQVSNREGRECFEASCYGIETLSQVVKDVLKATETFVTGKGEALYCPYRMDNADKHTVITPITEGSKVSKFVVVGPNGSRLTYLNNDFVAAKRVGTGAMILRAKNFGRIRRRDKRNP
jgi:hypothetical protein